MTSAIPLSVCVFCGSRNGSDPDFRASAEAAGREIARRGWRVVWGAGEIGLMGAVAKAAQDAGGEVFGVIPQHLVDREFGKRDADKYVVTDNMHTRKTVMFANSGAVLALPGGPGTLDELFEVLTWRQLGLHDRPIVLLNINGYWDGLVALIDHVIAQGFAEPSFRAFLTVTETVEEAMKVLDRYAE
ncbi:TIGR00730 family Rossman fold protein [Pontivivens ytuae]|uniref:Cytokinin riboside 5'-monophosphate phosphoribohydrolase n=1 Tax=Pontivivens ytuae TaxID=2789856 RepID=A0A7S9QCV9_9RHOB|nr:TIGR00730 family Rossman fold protein [Pontivivens ytuae]QPH54338.1 TIGR00730 family Rossman fold protein [Pontivivens ytuae]